MNALTPYRREGWLRRLPYGMEEVLEHFFGPPARTGETMPMAWAPRVDFTETEKAVVVKADLPGVAPENVEVTFADGLLKLHGEKKEEKKEEKEGFRRVERFTGEFYRELPMPAGVDPDKILATVDKGVLTITVPKKEEAKDRKIKITPKV